MKKDDETFKPGKKPYCKYQGSLLNANVAWNELVSELIESGISQREIADYAECSLSVIKDIQTKNYQTLWFRTGAKIAALHHRSSVNHCTVK